MFLSVDVDVVDPGMAPGTGTPEPGGLTGRQLLDAVRRIAMELPLAGMDVVEVSPPYDHAEVTAFLANRVVLEALSGIAWRRRRRPPTRPPARVPAAAGPAPAAPSLRQNRARLMLGRRGAFDRAARCLTGQISVARDRYVPNKSRRSILAPCWT